MLYIPETPRIPIRAAGFGGILGVSGIYIIHNVHDIDSQLLGIVLVYFSNRTYVL